MLTRPSATAEPSDVVSSAEETSSQPDGLTTSATVASLLSQLQAVSSLPTLENTSPDGSYDLSSYVETSLPSASQPPPPRQTDLRSLTFQQALPYVSQLSQDHYVVETVRKMKQEQAQLENNLWQERQSIRQKHEERVKIARVKANLIGAGLTQFEADSMTDSFRRELHKFDLERVLPAWDGLLARQQAALESLGVPTMYPTSSAAETKVRCRHCDALAPAVLTPHHAEAAAGTPSSGWCYRVNNGGRLAGPLIDSAGGALRRNTALIRAYPSPPRPRPPCLWASRLSCPIMPFVDIVARDDYASIWYWTNTYNNSVGIFDPEKPTIVLLHPAGLDSSWLQPQVEDPRLSDSYNMIMFDTRLSGQSQSRYTGKLDLWVTAADLAQAFYYLRLPPSHIFACDVSAEAALRFAALFPDLVLSLSLVNVMNIKIIREVVEQLDEICTLWARAPDLETFELGCKDMITIFGGPHAHPDLQDEIVAFWETTFPPWRRVNSRATMNLWLNRAPLTAAELAAVTSPTLIIQADASRANPIDCAEQLQRDLTGVEGGVNVFKVKTTAGYINIISASIVNQVLRKFVNRQVQLKKPSELRPVKETLAEFMGGGLARLAELQDNPNILLRDPCSPLSFSLVPPELEKMQMQLLEEHAKDQRKAFSPLGPDGRPIRKFSERHDRNHWLNTGNDGYTRTGP
ncbi:alpha/beta-hydrolase [Trametopsis cervina]|nr:alpha/beta-hydrolase [Trametopsis cervina]